MNIKLIPLIKLKAHEQTSPKRLQKLHRQLQQDRHLHQPIVVDKKTKVILDGHHRCRLLKNMGCKKIPALLVNYQSRSVQLKTRRKNLPVNKLMVVKMALSNRLLPYKTTRHILAHRMPRIKIKFNQLK